MSDRNKLADEVSRAFGPMEWFQGGYIQGSGLTVCTSWPTFDDETAKKIAVELNAVLRPYAVKARADLLRRLSEMNEAP
jgi:hypothetical protein